MSVGEASGDVLAAEVVDCLRERVPLHITALAGSQLAARADVVVGDARTFTAMGLAEVAPRLPRLIERGLGIRDALRRTHPDALLTVDSPGLNLRLAREATRLGIPVVHCVSPQVWAWRPGRVRRIAAVVDTLCCLFPFEPQWYAGLPVRAVFTGHPLAQVDSDWHDPQGPIALFPGSRREEVRRLWPAMRDAAHRLRQEQPELCVRVSVAPSVSLEWLEGLEGLCAHVVHGLEAARGASAAVASSGTVTLQLACKGIPQAVVYQLNPTTARLARWWVRGVRHAALPNILAGREIVPENLNHPTGDWIAGQLRALRGPAGRAQTQALQPHLQGLNAPHAAECVAGEVLGALQVRNR